METANLPVRVISNHEFWGFDEKGNPICVCTDRHPCQSRKKAMLAQLVTMAAMTMAATTEYLRIVVKLPSARAAHNLRRQMFDWIPAEIERQRLIART